MPVGIARSDHRPHLRRRKRLQDRGRRQYPRKQGLARHEAAAVRAGPVTLRLRGDCSEANRPRGPEAVTSPALGIVRRNRRCDPWLSAPPHPRGVVRFSFWSSCTNAQAPHTRGDRSVCAERRLAALKPPRRTGDCSLVECSESRAFYPPHLRGAVLSVLFRPLPPSYGAYRSTPCSASRHKRRIPVCERDCSWSRTHSGKAYFSYPNVSFVSLPTDVVGRGMSTISVAGK